MAAVQIFLVVGERMDSGHHTRENSVVIVDNFDDRSQAVGGAGGVGQNVLGRRIIAGFVNTLTIVLSSILARSGNDNFFRSVFQMDSSVLASFKFTGAL